MILNLMMKIKQTLRFAASRLSSMMTSARASGFTPLSHRRTHVPSDSASKPVLSSFDISIRAETM